MVEKIVSLQRYFCIFAVVDKLFGILFLEDASRFLDDLDNSHRDKIYYNIRKAQSTRDPELFKKLTEEIWEFRTLYMGLQYRLLAFWDKTGPQETLVISTHGFIKKRDKVPDQEIQKAKQMRLKYFADKGNEKNKSK